MLHHKLILTWRNIRLYRLSRAITEQREIVKLSEWMPLVRFQISDPILQVPAGNYVKKKKA
jgi:hypothetical protein